MDEVDYNFILKSDEIDKEQLTLGDYCIFEINVYLDTINLQPNINNENDRINLIIKVIFHEDLHLAFDVLHVETNDFYGYEVHNIHEIIDELVN